MRGCSIAALLSPAALAAPPLPCATSGQTYTPCKASWEFVGPAAYTNEADDRAGPERSRDDDDDDADDRAGAGRLEGGEEAPPLHQASATQVVAAGAGGRWFVGSVNGGVWRSSDIAAATPHWDPVTDGQPVRCASISALTTAGRTVVAGCGGSSSSEQGPTWAEINSGDWGGIMVSSDDGDTWRMTAFPQNYYVTGIVAISPRHLIASARSHFYDRDDGGVWVTRDGGEKWDRTLDDPVFFLHRSNATGTVYATVANDGAHTLRKSPDDGATWEDWSDGVSWPGGRLPFYPTFALSSGPDPVAFLGALTVNEKNTSDVGSAVFWRRVSGNDGWVQVKGQPKNLEQDRMPKDRMGLLADPEDPATLYVNGNAGAVAWRVDWAAGEWSTLQGFDAGSPHGDCRNFAWDPSSKQLLLVSDGGLFVRSQPKGGEGGRWRSANGDIGTMEFVSAAWDASASRWIGGAQDNGVQLAPPNTTGASVAKSVIGGDGTLTEADNSVSPARLWGACQGGHSNVGAGLAFIEGGRKVSIPISSSFHDARSWIYFVHPWTLNTQDKTHLVIFMFGGKPPAGVIGGDIPVPDNHESGWWDIEVPRGTTSASGVKKPTFVAASGGGVFSFVVGGMTAGKSDPSVLVGVNDTTLFHRSAAAEGLKMRPLPAQFATPVVFTNYFGRNHATVIRGPVSHGKTVSVAVHPADSATVAVTGWPAGFDNKKPEGVYVTSDAGETWDDVIGDLAAATATIGKARPSGLLFVDLAAEANASALLAGTVNGVFVSWTDRKGSWARLGLCADLPIVLTMGLQYEEKSDTLVAATFGRGVYALRGAKKALLRARSQQAQKSCSA